MDSRVGTRVDYVRLLFAHKMHPNGQYLPHSNLPYQGGQDRIVALVSATRNSETGAPAAGGVRVKARRDLVITPEKQLELLSQLLYVEKQCPCGARPESLNTHPHVSGCGINYLIRQIFDCTGAVII